MNLSDLKDCIKNNVNLYIIDQKIMIIEIFDIFNICEIMYLDNKEKEVVDIMGISDIPTHENFIPLYKLNGG